tara:strand:- start:1719 stop:2165 length:447 start_codon:yes stop_codon:yes gene_type:complete
MPTPFMCHWCDKPTMNETGICIECEQKYEEGNKDIAATIRELETKVRWLEKGLKLVIKIANDKESGLSMAAQAVLDGEPTTADEHNTMQEDEKLVYEDEHNCMIQYDDPGDENVVRISDVNKEIAKEWNRDREKKIDMITSIGYRGED